MNVMLDMGTRREHMSVPEKKDEPELKGARVMAYVLMLLGIALIPVGIILTLLRECNYDCEFVYIQQGIIVVGVGLFLIFLAILFMLVVPVKKPAAPMPIIPPGNVCMDCGGLLMWIPAQQRWYCNSCKAYK